MSGEYDGMKVKMLFCIVYALVMELADIVVSKTIVVRRGGSSPLEGTNFYARVAEWQTHRT